MKKEAWKRRIKKATIEVGTYRPSFESAITTLAEILEQRDSIKKYYEDSGAQPVVMHTNKGGASNVIKNPLLKMYDDLNNTALIYWRELGLTPKGLKAIDEKAMKGQNNKATLEEVFSKIGI